MTDKGPTLGLVDVDGTIRISKKRKTELACMGHGHAFLLNAEKRTVECSRCEQAFDAFDALLDMATVRDRYISDATYLRQQRDRLTKQAEEAKAAREAARASLSATNRRLKQRRAIDDYETTGARESRPPSSPASDPAP